MSTQIYQTYVFNPTKISGCQLWLDGADLTTLFTDAAGTTPVSASGQNVGYWKDKSTQANNATNSTNRPTVVYNTQNGLPAINFVASSSQFLNLDPTKLPNGSTNFSYFFVVKTTSSAVQVFFTNGATATNRMPQFYFSSYALVGDLFGGSSISDGNTYNNQFVVATYTGAAQFNGFDNDTSFSGTNNINVNLNTGTTYAFIGVSRLVDASPVFYLTGQIAEIIVYNRAVSTTERQQINGYLAWKWGLQTNFSSGFPYRLFPPFMNQIQLPATPAGPITVSNTPVFIPTQISGCVVWFDGADLSKLSLSGSTVNSWISKGTLSLTATSVGAGPIVYQKYNNLFSLRFNGTNTKMTTGTLSSYGASGTTWIACAVNLTAVTASTPADASVIFASTSAPERSIRYTTSGGYQIYSINNGTLRGNTTNTDNGVRGFIDTAASILTYANGTSLAVTNNISVTYQEGTNQTFVLGQWNVGNLDGYIQEIIVYNSALTLAQYQQVEGYLAWKWGFQGNLPTTHPYYKSPFPNQSMAPTPPYPPQITSASWQPVNISNCVLWLDAADSAFIIRSGTTISQWRDKSPSANNTTGASGSPQYTQNLLNKNPGVVFNGSSSYFTLPLVVNTNWSIFIVLSTTATGPGSGGQWWAGSGIFDAEVGGTTTDFGTSLYGSTFAVGVGNPPTGDNTIQSSTSINTGAGFLCEFQRVSSSGFFENFVNGSSQGSLTGGTGVRTAPTRIVLGALQTLGTYFNGNIFEVVVYSSYLTTGQRQQVEGYLAWKWGLQASLPGNHPYKLFPPPP